MFARLSIAIHRGCVKSLPRLLTLGSDANPVKHFDIMLRDVREEQLKKYAKLLGADELSDVSEDGLVWPVKGLIVGGSRHRVFVNLAVGYGHADGTMKRVWVPFLVDSASPFNYLSNRTMLALGIRKPSETTVNIHGFDDIAVDKSPLKGNFSDANVLGGDFFHSTHVVPLALYDQRAAYFFKDKCMLKDWITKNI